MRSDSNEQQERIETPGEESPSAGWRAVYAAMGVSTDGDVEKEATTDPRETSTEDQRLSMAGNGRRRVSAKS